MNGIQEISKGRGGKDNFPQSKAGIIQTEEDRTLVKQLLTEVAREYKQPKVKNDEELEARLNDYFTRCATTGQIPTVEEMVMCTGYSQAYIWDIQTGRRHGFTDRTAEILKKAKDFLMTFDAKLVVTGKLNFLAYCFRAKNYYGLSDRQDIVVTPNTPEADYNATDIAKRYALPEASDSSDSSENDS